MRIFVKGDIDGFIALFLDNLLMLILMSNMCLGFPLFFPPELFFGRVLPAAAVGLLIGNLFYSYQAHQLAVKENRDDVCALPFGISLVMFIAFVFLVMYPAKIKAESSGLSPGEASLVAWRAGLIACFISGLIEFLGAFVADRLRRVTPRAALLTVLAGISFAFLSLDYMFRSYAFPIIGMTTLGIAMILYFGRVRPRLGIPGGLVVLLTGTGLAWLMYFVEGLDVVPVGTLQAEFIGVHLPVPVLMDLVFAFAYMHEYLPIIIPMGFFSVVLSVQNIESAEAAGDSYSTVSALCFNGFSSMGSALFGSPFATTIYPGHPGWKEIGSRAGYSTLNALSVALICFSGTLSLVVYFVPIEAGMALVIWIGFVMAAQAFESVPRRHTVAVLIGLIPVLAAYTSLIIKRTLHAVGFGSPENPFPADLNQSFLEKAGFFSSGAFALEQGYIYSSMVLAAATVFILERKFLHAAGWFLAGAALSSIGFMHQYEIVQADVVGRLGLSFSKMTVAYLILAGLSTVAPLLTRPLSR